MIRRRLWASMIGLVVVTVGLLAFNIGTSREPVLGLDLQGGVSVVLRPTEDGATEQDLEVIRDLIRDQLEANGIAEPDVRVEGSNVVVDLPGVKDQQEALDAADVSGIVTFRPVLQCGLGPLNPETGGSTTVPESTTTTLPLGPVAPDPTTTTTEPGQTTTTAAGESSTATTIAPGDTTSDGAVTGWRSPSTPPSTDEPGSTTSTAPDSVPPTSDGATTTTPGATTTTAPVGEPSEDSQPTVLGNRDGTDSCLVGPSGGTGEIFDRGSASVQFEGGVGGGGWVVVVNLTDTGATAWNAIAAECFNGTQNCPSRQLAIVLDDIIQSAPQVNAASFPDEVSISGLDEDEARSLAGVIDRGAFPVQVEPATVQTVSATLGEDSMRASVFAGLVGVALVLVMLVVFYRHLTWLVLAGMVVWGMLIYSASTFISEWTNYALTLAGVTGIIVSIGMTVDSYVIYFERLKDEVRHGRTLKNSATRSFKATWRTILAANLISAIGAAVLFFLSVGSVRGFALYLGVTTICDVIVLWFFTRPAVILAASTGRLDRRNTFGLEGSS